MEQADLRVRLFFLQIPRKIQMPDISAKTESALFLPALDDSYATIAMAPAARLLPTGLTMADLNYFSDPSRLFTYRAGLYSAVYGVKQMLAGTSTMVTTRDRTKTILVGDSGGYSVIGGNVKTPLKTFRQQVLDWQEAHCDVGILLDVPTRSLLVPRSGYTRFEDCLDQTEENAKFAITNRKQSGLILCNVMQGLDHKQADAWCKTMAPYQSDLEGIALAGHTRLDLWAWTKRLIRMRDAKQLDRLRWVHVLGTARPGFGVMLTGMQKALRKHLHPEIRISFDSALAFRNVKAHNRVTLNWQLRDRDIVLGDYRFPNDNSALDRTKPFPFSSPIGDLCTYGDFNPGNPGSKAGWDAIGLTMLSNHEVYKEAMVFAEVNRLAEAEANTRLGNTPWHIGRAWEAFDLIWDGAMPGAHLTKYKKFLAHYGPSVGDDEEL